MPLSQVGLEDAAASTYKFKQPTNATKSPTLLTYSDAQAFHRLHFDSSLTPTCL